MMGRSKQLPRSGHRMGSVQCPMLSNVQNMPACLGQQPLATSKQPSALYRECEHAPAVEQVPGLRRGDAVARVRGARAAGVPRSLQPGRQPCKSNDDTLLTEGTRRLQRTGKVTGDPSGYSHE